MIIIGAGRVGTALTQAAEAVGAPCTLIDRRGQPERLATDQGPILLAVRNDDLDAVLARVPPSRRGELVLIQNGMLRPWIADQGLVVTRGLLFFAVPQRGAPLQPGKPSPFTGPVAAETVAWLDRVGVAATEVSAEAFAAIELEKLIWNCAFGLLSQRHDCSVGDVVTEHQREVSALVEEYLRVAEAALGLVLDPAALLHSLNAYSLAIAEYRGAVKEWRWRNGWFVAQAARTGVATPLHLALLRVACPSLLASAGG